MPEVGAIIAGKYRVGRAIGAGGMGMLDEAASRQMTVTLQEIMQLFGDGNFASANRRVNMAFASLTPAAPKRAAPGPNPDGKNPSSPRASLRAPTRPTSIC